MGEAVHAWNSMSYGEGFLFSVWVIGMYYSNFVWTSSLSE